MNNQLKTIDVYNQYVKEYEQKFMPFDLYNDTFDYLLEVIPLNSSILELGCGPGNVIKYFLNKRVDLKITGIDLAPEMLKRAKEINPAATFHLMDIRHTTKIKEQFDAIVSAFSLPYLSSKDLPSFFQHLKRLTKNNGFVYISCMEGESEKSGFEKTSFTGDSEIYIYYHQRRYLESLLAENEFRIEKFYTKDYPESDGSITTDLIYIAKKI